MTTNLPLGQAWGIVGCAATTGCLTTGVTVTTLNQHSYSKLELHYIRVS